MAALATQSMAYPSSNSPTYAAAAGGGDTLKGGDNVRLLVRNGGGAPITVTIPAYPTTTDYGAAIPGLVVSVPAAGEKWIGPLNGSKYTNPATGNVEVTYSGVTTVTVAVIDA